MAENLPAEVLNIDRSNLRKQSFDAIEQFQIPSTWARFLHSGARSRSVVFCPKGTTSVQICCLENDRQIDDEAAALFQKLVDARSTVSLLYSEKSGTDAATVHMFKILVRALGQNLVGDNQLSCSGVKSTDRAPAFHLENARVESVSGKKVLAIDGWFRQMDEKAQIRKVGDEMAKRFYSGIFFIADAKEMKVNEVYLIANDEKSFLSSQAIYKSVIQSIKWRE